MSDPTLREQCDVIAKFSLHTDLITTEGRVTHAPSTEAVSDRIEALVKAERKAALLEAFNDPWWPTPEQYEKFGFTTGHVAHFKFCMSQRARAEQEGE